jgi:hypothetical protein
MSNYRKTIDWRVPAKDAWQDSEADLQSEVVTRSLALAGKFEEIHLLHAIPNGDWRGWGTGKKLKAQGVIPGIPDLNLPVARSGFHGLYIELKKARGSVKADQWEIMEALHRQGHCVRLCNNLEVTLRIIRDYLEDMP